MRITKRYEMKVILHVQVFLMILAATACGHISIVFHASRCNLS